MNMPATVLAPAFHAMMAPEQCRHTSQQLAVGIKHTCHAVGDCEIIQNFAEVAAPR